MQKIFQYYILFFSFTLVVARDCNLVIIVDTLQQETVKTEEVNMTHQLVTALQQKSSAVLVSGSLWKNVLDRKNKFEKELQSKSSLASMMVSLYQRTNQELQDAHYNLNIVNQKLQHAWFVEFYPQLAALAQDRLNQLRFDFLCYMFDFDANQWNIYNPHTGMILFVPRLLSYQLNEQYHVDQFDDCVKHAEKRGDVVVSLQKLLLSDHDRWVIYLTGHGHPKSSKQDANIAGLKIEEFKKLLLYLHEHINMRLLVYSSCFGGGVHTIEPYENVQLHYPVIVTALTDAPIFGFGLFEGVKLPPYDDQFKLDVPDVRKHEGLQPCALQHYGAFFKRAWKGLFDLQLIQYISKFFVCDFMQCHVQKVENFPLIRRAESAVFTPLKDGTLFKLVQQVTSNSVVSSTKPMLLYTKKVKKIKIDKAVPIISMLPGVISHEIGEMVVPSVLFSSLLSESFLSLEDMQAYKNFIIKKLFCCHDIFGSQQTATLTNVLILAQKNLMPKFIGKQSVDALIYFEHANQCHLVVWYEQKIVKQMILDKEQIHAMQQILNLVQCSIDYKAHSAAQLLTFDAYLENKAYQEQLVNDCVKVKVCKK